MLPVTPPSNRQNHQNHVHLHFFNYHHNHDDRFQASWQTMECVELQTTRSRRPIALAASLASPVLLQGEDDHGVHVGDDAVDLGEESSRR